MNPHDLPPVPPAEVPPEAHSGFMARFRNYFLTGLIVAGPIAITFYLTWWFVTWVDGIVRPFVPIAYRPETYLPVKVPGFRENSPYVYGSIPRTSATRGWSCGKRYWRYSPDTGQPFRLALPTTGLRRTPRRSTSTSTTSPGCSSHGGVRE